MPDVADTALAEDTSFDTAIEDAADTTLEPLPEPDAALAGEDATTTAPATDDTLTYGCGCHASPRTTSWWSLLALLFFAARGARRPR